MSAYIQKKFRSTKAAYDLVRNWTKGLNQETFEVFVHVLKCTLHRRPEQGEYVPVPSQVIQKTWGSRAEVLWMVLVARELLEVKELENGKDYSRASSQCREYRVPHDKVQEFLDADAPKGGEELINLFDGRKMKKYARHDLKTVEGNNIPPLVKNSIQSIHPCPINLKEIESLQANREAEILFGRPTERDIKVHRIDKTAINTLKKSNLKTLEDGLAEYEPGYRMQSTGRITEIGVGMQNCTREMKDRAFNGIKGLINYDLKSSQVWGLIQWFEFANLDKSWLLEYLGRDKQEYADAVGISKDCWKKCFMALIMGGSTLSKTEQKALEAATTDKEIKDAIRHKITEYLLEEAGNSLENLVELNANFDQVTKPLQEELEKWHKWLVEVHPTLPGVSSYPRGIHTLTNATGASFNLSEWKNKKGEYKNKGNLGMKLAAFWLQGTEAAFIHHLTVVSENYGYKYKVVSNQHDGLVTLGEIPEEAVEYARQQSGLKYANLEKKSFL